MGEKPKLVDSGPDSVAGGDRRASRGARPWRPGPLLWVSIGLHVGCLAAALGGRMRGRRRMRGAAALLVADHAALALTGLWPRSRLLGPNLTRLPEAAARRGEVALTFDDGPDPRVTPVVLDLLARHGARATFFCVGERVARWPELAAEIVRQGHRVENHTQTHPWQFSLLARGIAREIDRAQETIERATGVRPRYLRAPAGLRNLLLEPVLARRGLWLVSWTRRGLDAFGGDPGEILRRLERGLAAGDVLVLHDGPAATGARWASARASGEAEEGAPPVLRVLPALLETLERRGLRSVPLPGPTG